MECFNFVLLLFSSRLLFAYDFLFNRLFPAFYWFPRLLPPSFILLCCQRIRVFLSNSFFACVLKPLWFGYPVICVKRFQSSLSKIVMTELGPTGKCYFFMNVLVIHEIETDFYFLLKIFFIEAGTLDYNRLYGDFQHTVDNLKWTPKHVTV